MADWSAPSAPPTVPAGAGAGEPGRSEPVRPGSPPVLAGGRVLGAFDYTSSGQAGWHVVHRSDLGGLSDDAVAEGSRLIERLPWWPTEPRAAGGDPYQRPRRLAWLGGAARQRRFLVHTIHAENDASNRPDNNYTECLIVGADSAAPDRPGRPPAGQVPPPTDQGEARGAVPVAWTSTRPSQLWSLDSWASPWGPSAVGQARPGAGRLTPALPPQDVFTHIVSETNGMARLRTLLRAIHRAIHLGGPPVTGRVDDLVWGAALLDTAISLLPAPAVWDVTFDLRSVAPTGRAATPSHRPRSQAVVMLLGRHDQPVASVPGTLNLTGDASVDALDAALAETTDADCPRCGLWLTSVDLLLRQSPAPTWDQVAHQVADLEAGQRRLGGLTVSTAPPRGTAEAPPSQPTLQPAPPRPAAPQPAEAAGPPPPSQPGTSHPIPPAPRGGAPAPVERTDPPATAQPLAGRSGASPTGQPAASSAQPALDLQSLDAALEYLTGLRDSLVGLPDTVETRARVEQAWVNVQGMAARALQKLAATHPGMQVHSDAAASTPRQRWIRHSRGRNS